MLFSKNYNSILKKIHYPLTILVIMHLFVSCQKNGDYIEVVVQPKLKVNETTNFEIFFKEIPDYGTLIIEDLDAFKLNDWPYTSINDSLSNKDVSRHFYITYITPLEVGILKTPRITAKFNGVEHTLEPFPITSSEDIEINETSVLLELRSDKKNYKIKDTITISLFEYSKFSKLSKTPYKNTINYSFPKIKSEVGKSIVEVETDLFMTTGIAGLENYIVNNFEGLDYDWYPLQENRVLEKRDNELYIKNEIFKIVLLPKKKGNFIINKSSFRYSVYTSNDEYFDGFVPNEKGSYNVTDNSSKRLIVNSNALHFKVK